MDSPQDNDELLSEVSNNRNIPPAPIVMLNFFGYGTDGEPPYVFQWHTQQDGSDLPTHNHRDNLPNNGGFAFSVYDPGPGLSQHSWHV